jgi:uncharacterized protein (TIRG00374 family)
VNRQRLIDLAKVVVTAALLAVLALTVDLRQIGRTLVGVRWGPLLAALAVYQLGLFVRAYRWQALLGGLGARVPLRSLLRLYYVGTFFNSFLPSGFGGDAIRMYELSRHGVSGAAAISTVLADRVLGLLVLFAMALVALPFSWRLVPATVVVALLALIAGSALGLWLLLNRRLVEALARRLPLLARILHHEKVAALYASFHQYPRGALLRAAAASFLFNTDLILAQACLAWAVGVHIGLGYFLLFVPILSALLALPISVSGFGVREGGYLVLFGQAGVASGEAVAMSLLFYAMNLATGLVGAVLYVLQGARAAAGRRA